MTEYTPRENSFSDAFKHSSRRRGSGSGAIGQNQDNSALPVSYILGVVCCADMP